MDNPNDKGNIAEMAIALEAMKLGLPVYKPLREHERYDLVIEIGSELKKVQCKWGRIESNGTICVGLVSSRYTPAGRISKKYAAGEVDLLAVHCGANGRCYLLPEPLFVDRGAVHLRLDPVKNGQRSCINLAADYEFAGAVAQLARAFGWQPKGRGFESPQLHSSPPPPQAIGSNEFRNRLGYYLDLVASGQELLVTRWGHKLLRVAPAT